MLQIRESKKYQAGRRLKISYQIMHKLENHLVTGTTKANVVTFYQRLLW